ncbi:MAG TPA: hypothetical protein VJ875_24635 [Pyrinomonadaceae bacterium]|nr:hypothetical protein [Pyrinomonadaceae bacterium]
MRAFKNSHRAEHVMELTSRSQKDERGIVNSAEIILLSPATGSLITEARPMFRWTLSNPRRGVQRVLYELKIVELRQAQTLDEALTTNPSVIDRRDLAGNSFQFPERGTQLVAERVYAWRVTAFDPNGKEVGHSGASFFGVNKWPTWTFCSLILSTANLDYCIGQMKGLAVGTALMTGTGPYSWTLTGATTGTGQSFSSTITIPAGSLPQTPGTYTLTLTVTRGNCTQTANFTVVVDVPPVAGTITVTPDPPATQLPLCPGQDAILTLNGQSSPGLIQWYSSLNQTSVFNNPIAGASNNTTQYTNPLSATTYFGVQVSSVNGACPPAYTTVPVFVKPPHGPVTISGPPIICVGASATLTVTSGSAGCTSFQWFCDGAPCGPNSSSMTVTDPGNYLVECFDGCATVPSNMITIQQDLLAVTITGPCCPCKGQKIKLCAQPVNGTPPYNYQWTANAGGGVTQCTLVIPVNTTTYSVTVTDANGCQAMDSFTATVCP